MENITGVTPSSGCCVSISRARCLMVFGLEAGTKKSRGVMPKFPREKVDAPGGGAFGGGGGEFPCSSRSNRSIDFLGIWRALVMSWSCSSCSALCISSSASSKVFRPKSGF